MKGMHVWITGVGVLRSNPADIHEDVPGRENLISHLMRIHDQTPMQLTTIAADRDAMLNICNSKWCIIQRKAKDAMLKALEESQSMSPPILQPTDYELIAWTDEFHTVKCRETLLVTTESVAKNASGIPINQSSFSFTEGNEYEIRLFTKKYKEPFTRNKVTYNPTDRSLSHEEHQMVLHGKDQMYSVYDDFSNQCFFTAHPSGPKQVSENIMWDVFEKPPVPTIAKTNKKSYQKAMDQLGVIEMLQGFNYYPGQKEYIASLACLKSALIAAETGCGKTLAAASLIMLHNVDRVLICAPKGTVEEGDEFHVAQWLGELRKFGCHASIYVINKREYVMELMRDNGGELPKGIFLVWPQALFTSGDAFECIPSAWRVGEREEKALEKFGYLPDEDGSFGPDTPEGVSVGIGKSFDGIRCIGNPSLSTMIGEQVWDMVILDEAHLICNLDSQTTQAMIRLEPPYRYGLSATPLPNMVYNIFSLMGWICVPKWHHGGLSNKRWPYARDDLSRFKEHFVSYEEDVTEKLKRQHTGKNPPSLKPSPIISQSGRLLKLLKPSMGYISKEECNPKQVPVKIMTTKVPMGRQQYYAYSHIVQPKNIPFSSPKTIMGVQQTWLRSLCACPVDAVKEYNLRARSFFQLEDDEPDILRVDSNYNPKTIAILNKIYDILAEGRQVVHVSARINQSSEIERRLGEAGIKCSRIDSTTPKHAKEAAKFKAGDTQVMLMGINCAQAYSFEQCHDLIIGSLEWSYGKLNQAMGRVYRLTSTREVNIYVFLHNESIEELLFEKVGLKEDAATICLKGRHVPRTVENVHPDDIIAEHLFNFNKSAESICESACEEDWPIIREKLISVSMKEAA